jgi:uncharacterized protein YdeI (YjbR/CyaY-like superfamily)
MSPTQYTAFPTPQDLWRWFESHHASKNELWVQIYKKGSGVTSVTWEDCVIAALAWGWIDSQKQTLDDISFTQRFTPRKAKSTWSQKNREHVDRLIVDGRMQPSGLVHVDAAKADGRWESAYARASEMVLPDDFLAMLDQNAEAKAFYHTLNRTNLFTIYHRLQTAIRPETRTKRMEAILEQLKRKELFR